MMPINEWWLIGGLASVTLALIFYTQGPIWWSGLRAMVAGLLVSPAILYSNGIDDDTPGLRAWLTGQPVLWSGGAPVERTLKDCTFHVEHVAGDWMVEPGQIDSPRALINCTFVDRTGQTEQITMIGWKREP